MHKLESVSLPNLPAQKRTAEAKYLTTLKGGIVMSREHLPINHLPQPDRA